MTNTSGGIRVMRRDIFSSGGDRWDAPNIGFIITDGVSNRDSHLVAQVRLLSYVSTQQ